MVSIKCLKNTNTTVLLSANDMIAMERLTSSSRPSSSRPSSAPKAYKTSEGLEERANSTEMANTKCLKNTNTTVLLSANDINAMERLPSSSRPSSSRPSSAPKPYKTSEGLEERANSTEMANTKSVKNSNITVLLSAKDKAPQMQCFICNAILLASNMSRHRKSKRCSSITTSINLTSTNSKPQQVSTTYKGSQKKPCLNCGVEVTISNMSRHRRSKKCEGSSTERKLVVPLKKNLNLKEVTKQTCPTCGIEVVARNMPRHSKSKKCNSNLLVCNKIKRLGIKPAPEAVMCWVCEKFIEKARLISHTKSESHNRKMMLHSVGHNTLSDSTKKRIKDRKSPRLPAPSPDITKLAAKYPVPETNRRCAKPIQTIHDDEVFIRRQTKPINPSAYTCKANRRSPSPLRIDSPTTNFDVIDWINAFTSPISPITITPAPSPKPESVDNVNAESYLKESDIDDVIQLLGSVISEARKNVNWNEDKFRSAICDFDPSLFDEPMKEDDLFQPPKRVIHPESEKLRNILGSPPGLPEITENTSWDEDDLELDFTNPSHTVINNRESSLNIPDSPVYNSPLHFPASPTYSLLSSTHEEEVYDDTTLDGSYILVDSPVMGYSPMSSTGHSVDSHVMEFSPERPTDGREEIKEEEETKPTLAETIRETSTAFKGRLKTYTISNLLNYKDVSNFFDAYKPLVIKLIENEILKYNIKSNIWLYAVYKRTVNGENIERTMNFKTINMVLLSTSDVSEFYDKAKWKIMGEMEEFQDNGSQWMLKNIEGLEVRLNKYVPLKGSSYMPLPPAIENRKAIINIRNNDQKCFIWSILAALHLPKKDPQRVSKYKQYEQELDEYLKGIDFPVKLTDVPRFEKRAGISVNVYAYDEKFVVYPLLVTNEEREKHVDLLYIKDDKQNHYCYIKNLEKLVNTQITKYNHRIWICRRCLQHFGREDLLKKHKLDCVNHKALRIELPEEYTNIKFNQYNCSMRVPFVFYADFECCLVPIKQTQEERDGVTIIKPHTLRYQKHHPVSFCLYGTYDKGIYKPPHSYFGKDAASKFVDKLVRESKEIKQRYNSDNIVPMLPLTDDELKQVNTTETCHICRKELLVDRVLDHDHISGKFRGVAHNKCNLNYKKPKFIPVFIHNLAGYDTHLFIKQFGEHAHTINVIPNNEERYISFSVKVVNGIELRFLDSFKFMSLSLDTLVSNLPKDRLVHTTRHYETKSVDLLLRKGVYPYDYMDSFDKYKETSLPPKSAFYNRLNKSDITERDYEHACMVWFELDVKDLKEYTLLYNTTDVLLLADVMENFRDVCMGIYKLDPAWYYTAPGLAWSAMLKTTEVELELLTDINMLLMWEKMIRGGISQCSNRYAKANNPYMRDYDNTQPCTYLTYLDMNNLYGHAMCQPMPIRDFHWVKNGADIGADINVFDVTRINDHADTGYILEVDLAYPEKIHDQHSDLPLAPEHMCPPGSKEAKLLTTLCDKERYVLHYRNLKLYLSLGMQVTKVHRIISFKQSTFLKKYIDLNTELRTKAKNNFEKDFYKLMNNAVFGKTMENIRNRVDIRLVTNKDQVEKLIAKPGFKSRRIFTETLAAIHMAKVKMIFNKPIYVGACVLDVSKLIMYDFHYNVMQKRYGDNITLHYTDTDSLTYKIQTDDFYQDMQSMIDYFDTSDYSENNPYGMPRVNKKILGKMKDELNGSIMREFVGLRSKMYAYQLEDESEKNMLDSLKTSKRSKGVKKSVVLNEISFTDYKQCLFQGTTKYRSMNMIRSFNHDLYSVELFKSSLCSIDDKRYIFEDGVKSLPWGHYKIPHTYK